MLETHTTKRREEEIREEGEKTKNTKDKRKEINCKYRNRCKRGDN